MGLKLRINLFRAANAEDVLESFSRFYQRHGQTLINEGVDFYQFTLHRAQNDWSLLNLDGGWEWERRREAQLWVTKELNCSGFLIFVYDGDFWGYEFFNRGIALDHFIQDLETGMDWFPGESCSGDAQLIGRHLTFLDSGIIGRYLVHDPKLDEIRAEQEENESWIKACDRLDRIRNIKAQPGDQFAPFDECFAVDFLRFLGVKVELKNGYVTFLAPILRKFWISKQNTHEAWNKHYRWKQSS